MADSQAWLVVVSSAVGTALWALVMAGLLYLRRRSAPAAKTEPWADHRGTALTAGLLLASFVAVLRVSPDAAGYLVLTGLLLLWAAVLALTDGLVGPRGLRAAMVAVLLLAVAKAGLSPPLEAVKVPFATRVYFLGAAGWVVSWVWLAVFGSLFARAGTVIGVVPGLTVLAGLTFAGSAALRPDLVRPGAGTLALALAAAGLALAPLERLIRLPRASAGAYGVGVVVAWASALGMVKNTALLALLIPLLIIGVPLFAAVAPAAAGRRRDFPEAGPQHLHEVLMRQGYSEAQVAGIVLAGAAYLCALALLLVFFVQAHWAAKLALTVAGLALGGVVGFAAVRLIPRAKAPAPAGPVEVKLFGLRVHGLTMQQAMERAAEFIRSGQPHYFVTCDASAVVRAQDDEEFRRIVNEADLVTADGAGVVLAARLLGLPVQVRVAGCDMVEALCRVAAREGGSVFFLGAEPGVAEEAAAKLAERVPGLKVAGCQDGYFRPEEEEAVVRRIAELRPAVLFVALGQPRQEQFIAAHLSEIGARVAMGIGGSLDVISGRKKRAPLWMQRAGLEWLYRVACEPWRLPRLKALPRLMMMVASELARGPRDPGEEGRKRP